MLLKKLKQRQAVRKHVLAVVQDILSNEKMKGIEVKIPTNPRAQFVRLELQQRKELAAQDF